MVIFIPQELMKAFMEGISFRLLDVNSNKGGRVLFSGSNPLEDGTVNSLHLRNPKKAV